MSAGLFLLNQQAIALRFKTISGGPVRWLSGCRFLLPSLRTTHSHTYTGTDILQINNSKGKDRRTGGDIVTPKRVCLPVCSLQRSLHPRHQCKPTDPSSLLSSKGVCDAIWLILFGSQITNLVKKRDFKFVRDFEETEDSTIRTWEDHVVLGAQHKRGRPPSQLHLY